MLFEKERSIKSKRVPIALIGLALLLCGVIGFAVNRSQRSRRAGGGDRLSACTNG
jgi:hypothetical protein